MKKVLLFLTVLCLCFYFDILVSGVGQISNFFGINLDEIAQTKTFTEQLQKEILGLQRKKEELESNYSARKIDLEKFQASLEILRQKSKESTETDQDFISKSLLLFNQIVQVLTEIEQDYLQIIRIIDDNIKILQEFKDDPEFKAKNLQLPPKSIYSIEDLQKINDLLLQQENKVKNVTERLKKLTNDIDTRKKTLVIAKQEYEDKKKEQKELKSKDTEGIDKSEKFTLKQLGEILDAEEKLLAFKKELALLRVQEIEQKIQLIETELRISKAKLVTLEKEYERVKLELRIDEKDIKKAEEDLKDQIQESTKKQEDAHKRIEALDLLKTNELSEINEYKQKYEISDSDFELIKNWNLHPNSVKNWLALITIGRLSNHISFEIDISRENILAQIDYEKAKVTDKEIDNLIINSWYKIITGKFDKATQEIISKEIKQYAKAKVDIKANIYSLSDKINFVSAILNSNSRITENIKNRIKEFREQKDTVFKDYQTEFNSLSVHLKDEAYDDAPRRGESIVKLIELYNNAINIRRLTIKKIDSIIEELETKMQWVGGLILWRGLTNFIPDIKRFFKFIYEKNIVSVLNGYKQSFKDIVAFYKHNPAYFISFLLQIIIILIIFALIRLYLQDIINGMNIIKPKYGISQSISSFFISILSFINNNLNPIFIWMILFLLFRYKFIFDNYFGILFYLISIPFWMFFVYKYTRYIAKLNIETDYSLVRKEYQRRFLTVLSFFFYSTIIILFFREAFLLAYLPHSEVPTTLLALNFIILQISLICILSKEQILEIIPQTTHLWKWVYNQVENYYYLFLTGIIFIVVMSNPYIGYGLNFFYIVSRLILIILLIPFFMAIHNRIKRIAANLFIYSAIELNKERFPYARTAYGVFVILSFLFFVALILLLAAHIWGYNIDLDRIYEWLSADIYGFKDPDTGRHVPVTILDFAKVLVYVFAGIIFAYLINKYVLERMFDLLLVNIGVQNAIISLVRYTIIIASIIIGLKSVGMGSLMTYFLVIMGALGFAGKEVVTDFLGYFIILVQRPIKIGDFIRIDDEVLGVVRHITLRSVILRRRNSVTIIVPNSQIMNRPIVNWNYSRSYFAFDDILLTVPYIADPSFVKELMLKVLDNNLNVLKNPAPIVWLHGFTDNGFLFLIRAYLSFDKVLEQWEIASGVRIELVKALRANGLDVASPTRLLKVVDQKISVSREDKMT